MHAPTATWETFVGQRMAGPVPYIFSVHRIERVDPPPGPPEGGPVHSERAMLHYRAGFSPDPALAVAHRTISTLGFTTDYSVGSAIPLHAYVAWQDQPEPPDREPLGRFPRLRATSWCDAVPSIVDLACRIRAARKLGPGFTLDEGKIRAVIRRHYLPAAADVLSARVNDVQGLEGIHSFEDWVDELGLEPPKTGRFAPWLRYWRAVYDRTVSIAVPVRAFFGEQWDQATELVRDL